MAWKIDPVHSQITFAVRHMMVAWVRGHFEELDGTIELDENNPAASTVDIKIAAASINTRMGQRDAHLRSPDFFNADEHPYLTFKSSRVEVQGPSTARLYGDLTIRGITHEVALDVEYEGQARSSWGGRALGFSAQTKINRRDWGLNWNQAIEAGGVLVGDEIKIDVELELVEQVEEPAEAEAVAA